MEFYETFVSLKQWTSEYVVYINCTESAIEILPLNFLSRCRKGYRYVENRSCVIDPCFEENRHGELCDDLDCVVTNDTAVCR